MFRSGHGYSEWTKKKIESINPLRLIVLGYMGRLRHPPAIKCNNLELAKINLTHGKISQDCHKIYIRGVFYEFSFLKLNISGNFQPVIIQKKCYRKPKRALNDGACIICKLGIITQLF